jgi:pyruvate,water dikinase
LLEADLLRSLQEVGDDPNKLHGTPCCPGVVEGTVRVVETLADAAGINGDILVTSRTDPGWVPLFPSCSGLLIERGSLLSHSAVVARELGLPTIVGVNGGLMKRLQTGDRVRIDAGKGEITILR